MRLTSWNFIFCTAILSFIYVLIPFIKEHKVSIKEAKEPAGIIQTNSRSNLWKRGKYNSSLTVEENSSTSIVTGEKKRSSEGWISINWKKNHDSNR
jgi:hypothetical protein